MTLISGSKVQIGKNEYVLPNLNFGAMIELSDDINALMQMGREGSSNRASLEAILKIATACLRRNYHDITEQMLRDQVESYQIEALTAAVCEQFVKKGPEGV